eukprot:10285240-Prorocentrum_lima.AAC.1
MPSSRSHRGRSAVGRCCMHWPIGGHVACIGPALFSEGMWCAAEGNWAAAVGAFFFMAPININNHSPPKP